MTKSASDVAEEMRAVSKDRVESQQLLASLLAETIQLRHEPPSASDGPIPGRLLAEVSRREVEAVGRALSGIHTDSEIVAEDDTIRVRGRTVGNLDDGTAVDVRTDTVFTVANGSIVGLRSDMSEASMAAWGKVLMAGGFEIPEDFLAAINDPTPVTPRK